MSRVNTSLALLAVSLAALAPACASKPDAEAELAAAMAEATKPASQEERDAANRADPLTRANFWSKEYQKDATNLPTALEFAEALRGIGSDERAVEVLSEILVIYPKEPDLLMALGRALAGQNNALGAARAFEQAAQIQPARAEAWAALGTALDRLERHKDAQECYRKALAIEPARTSTLANYGLSLALSGNLDGAETQLRQAADQPDANVQVTENLALILGLQGKYDEMLSISQRHAPEDVARRNADILKEMVPQAQRVSDVTTSAKPGALPARPTDSGGPLPANAEPVTASPAGTVREETMGEPEAGQDTKATEPSGGLRLRRTNG